MMILTIKHLSESAVFLISFQPYCFHSFPFMHGWRRSVASYLDLLLLVSPSFILICCWLFPTSLLLSLLVWCLFYAFLSSLLRSFYFPICNVGPTLPYMQLRVSVYGEMEDDTATSIDDSQRCSSIIHIIENESVMRESLCTAGVERSFKLYESSGNELKVYFENKSPVNSVFLVEFRGRP